MHEPGRSCTSMQTSCPKVPDGHFACRHQSIVGEPVRSVGPLRQPQLSERLRWAFTPTAFSASRADACSAPHLASLCGRAPPAAPAYPCTSRDDDRASPAPFLRRLQRACPTPQHSLKTSDRTSVGCTTPISGNRSLVSGFPTESCVRYSRVNQQKNTHFFYRGERQ